MKKNKDLILIGKTYSTFFSTTLNTLYISFLLSNKTIYQIIALAGCVIAALINKTINTADISNNKFYKYRNKIFILESIINLALVPAIVLLNNEESIIVVGIAVIVMKPCEIIQSINIKILVSEIYSKTARLQHDLLYEKYSSYINVAAYVTGFLANKFVPANIAFTILLIVEASNNLFYVKQKPLD